MSRLPALQVLAFVAVPLVAGLAAGLFEETSRAALHGLLAWRDWLGDGRRAVVLGLGHGGAEALLFGAGSLAWIAAGSELQPAWAHALFGLSRPLLLLCHMGFNLLGWRAIRDRRPGLWVAAVLLHVACGPRGLARGEAWIRSRRAGARGRPGSARGPTRTRRRRRSRAAGRAR